MFLKCTLSSPHPFAIFRICEAVDRKWEDDLINCKRSVLFRLNFALAEMFLDRLEDEEDSKNISLPSFRRKKNPVDVTDLEEKPGRRSGTCNYI